MSFPAEILRTGANIMMIGLKEAASNPLLGKWVYVDYWCIHNIFCCGKGFSSITVLTGSDQAQ